MKVMKLNFIILALLITSPLASASGFFGGGGASSAVTWASISDAPFADWTTFTPSHSAISNVTSVAGKYRRVNDTMEAAVTWVMGGTPGSTTLTLTIPASLSIDTNKLPSTAVETVLGYIVAEPSDAKGVGVVTYENSTSVRVRGQRIDAANGHGTVSDLSAMGTWASGDVISIKFSVPIVGW